MFKKIFTFFLLYCLTFPTYALDFHDVKETDWFYHDLIYMVEEGMVSGYEDGSFRPSNSVTVAEFATILCQFSGFSHDNEHPSSEHWAKNFVDTAYRYGWFTEYPSDFSAPVSRLMVADSILSSLGIKAYDTYTMPFTDISNPVATAVYDMGILVGSFDEFGNRLFSGDINIKRSELCTIICSTNDYLTDVYGKTDFRYRIPQVPSPDSPTVSVEYFRDLILYMMIHNISDYELVFSNSTLASMETLNIYEKIFTAFEYIRAKHHEYGCFYENIDIHAVQIGYTVSLNILISDQNFSHVDLNNYKNSFLYAMPTVVATLFADGLVRADMTDYEKAEKFYQWCATEFQYDLTFQPLSFTGYGILQNKTGVCQGYVAVYNMLCLLSGIEVVGIEGDSNGANHIWSYANLDGTWYHIDPTWGDPTPDREGYYNMNYFALTEEEIARDHTIKTDTR